MPTSNQKKVPPGKTAAKSKRKTESNEQEDSLQPDPQQSEAASGYVPASSCSDDLDVHGEITLHRGGEKVMTLKIRFLLAGIFDNSSVAQADMEFSTLVQSAITNPLNRKVRKLCETLIRETNGGNEFDSFDDPAADDSALPGYAPSSPVYTEEDPAQEDPEDLDTPPDAPPAN